MSQARPEAFAEGRAVRALKMPFDDIRAGHSSVKNHDSVPKQKLGTC